MMFRQGIYIVTSVVLLVSLLSSCVPYTSLINFNATPILPVGGYTIENYRPLKVQTNDVLYIEVASEEVASAQLFNKSQTRSAGGGASSQSILLSGYLVNQVGIIDFPLLGSINVAGKSLDEVKIELISRLREYFIKDPVVTVRLLNFNINVNGEVNSPGAIAVATERMTALDAITQAGDFTPYSRRDSVLVIRELDGRRDFGYLDFNSVDVLESPYFYLMQNDVIYVQPEKRKLGTVRDRETRYLPWVSASTGFIAFIISIISLSK